MTARNIFYAQSGGVTAAINASACGVIEAAREHSQHFGKVYAGRDGILGALTEDLIDTSNESPEAIAALRHTPGGAFGSARHRLKGLDDNRAEYERLIEVFQAHDIGYFLYNGGGDSADTCLKISQLAEKMDLPIQAIHIPKTMDNDLPHTDCSPGFGSVAKYTAVSIREAGFDLASMCATSTKVFILEVMGRHAGWTAAAGGLAAADGYEDPHICLFPEIPFDEQAFLDKVHATVAERGYCTVVASEGVRTPQGRFLAEAGSTDAFGHSQLGGVAPMLAGLVKDKLGYKYHYAIADYLMRAARHIASATDIEQSYAVGRAAVEYALAGKSGIMVTIEREDDTPYTWSLGQAPLTEIANVEKKMPRDYISDDGFHITAAARRYLQPLIAGEDYPPFGADGLPRYATLRNTPVAKKTGHTFAV